MIRFAYPSLAAPTALVELTDGEQMPCSTPFRGRQNVFSRGGDTPSVVYEFDGDIEVRNMHLGPVSKADSDALVSFYREPFPRGVNKRAGVFQLQDSDGQIYNVQFQQDVMEAQKVGVSWYNLSLTLRILSRA